MCKTIVFLLFAGCVDGSGLDSPDAVAPPVSFPLSCGSVRWQYVPCQVPGEVSEGPTCDCAASQSSDGVRSVCRHQVPTGLTVCYEK